MVSSPGPRLSVCPSDSWDDGGGDGGAAADRTPASSDARHPIARTEVQGDDDAEPDRMATPETAGLEAMLAAGQHLWRQIQAAASQSAARKEARQEKKRGVQLTIEDLGRRLRAAEAELEHLDDEERLACEQDEALLSQLRAMSEGFPDITVRLVHL